MSAPRSQELAGRLDTVRALLSRSLDGDYADHELTGAVMEDALAGLAEALQLPPGWGIGELDQAIAELKEAARA